MRLVIVCPLGLLQRMCLIYCTFLTLSLLSVLQPELEVRNQQELLSYLRRHPQGVLLSSAQDAYKGVLKDVEASLC